MVRAAATADRRQAQDAAEALWGGRTPSEAAARAVLNRFRLSGRIGRPLTPEEEVARVREERVRAVATAGSPSTEGSSPLTQALRPRSKAECVAEFKAFRET